MAWRDAVDGYCERLTPGYWAEPVNAVTNMAFLVAAALMWRRTAGLPLARAMVLVLAAIGVGSYLFHTHANRATGVMDVIPIVAFILLYVFAASRDFLRLAPWQAGLATAFRTLDEPLCAVWPMGTHFLWHLLNAVMLGWMINVYVRHRRQGLICGQGPAKQAAEDSA
ncbi:MAG: ceramidase [Rhodobacter sp.]|nr:ceramidase [Rhodobacter sp.]